MSLGIPLFSHVPEISVGLPKLLNHVAGDVSIPTAGGTNDGDIGTSMEKIMQDFDDNEEDNLLAFYALGGAKMNLDMTMEMSNTYDHLYETDLIESAFPAHYFLKAVF
ncbi:PTS mannose family transporter subunit IIA, partial [Lactobacillus taiwanensis]|uniref:PTS sugar transporter subunit IIA domain-containing protein n=1 Tax=Lactobacillus taiwanensis TaxID=508451 RepID=UPI000B9965C8